MSNTANQQQTEPELRALIRRFLRGICVVATFFSAFSASHGLLMTGQCLSDEIRPGRIESISGQTKSGPRLRLDNGHEVVFPREVLDKQPQPVQLATGDHVEKRPDSFEYVVNGTPLTDVGWVVRNWLLPVYLLIPLSAYLFVGTLYVLSYRRTPFGDLMWPDDETRPRRPHTRAGMILAVFASWLIAVLLLTTVLGCIGGCLFGVGNALRG